MSAHRRDRDVVSFWDALAVPRNLAMLYETLNFASSDPYCVIEFLPSVTRIARARTRFVTILL